MSVLNKVPRTLLFVPGDKPDRFAKAAASQPDAVILDLEDAVAPASKNQAREHIAAHTLEGISVYARINAFGTDWFEEDLKALQDTRIDAILLPKTEGRREVQAVQQIIGRPVSVVALIETASGIASLSDILSEPAVMLAAFGSLDYALDLGCAHSWEALVLARAELVFRSRLHGKPAPIDGVTTDFRNLETVAADAKRAVELGFGGKLLIHPSQVLPARAAFLPDAKAAEWARRVLASIGENGAGSIDGTMIDLPVIERARRILRDIS